METINTSGLKPLGRAVLCKPYTAEVKKGLIEIPKGVADRRDMIDQRVRVVEVGPACWPDEAPRAVPGDLVLVATLSGFTDSGEMTLDGESYRLVNDRDIFCGLVLKEANHE